MVTMPRLLKGHNYSTFLRFFFFFQLNLTWVRFLFLCAVSIFKKSHSKMVKIVNFVMSILSRLNFKIKKVLWQIISSLMIKIARSAYYFKCCVHWEPAVCTSQSWSSRYMLTRDADKLCHQLCGFRLPVNRTCSLTSCRSPLKSHLISEAPLIIPSPYPVSFFHRDHSSQIPLHVCFLSFFSQGL